ncbi:hypothetical protein fugu_020128 [Takifugu bimaculatus]|uniref:Beta-2-microglobulin n=1 Tax=Takifugu bimaculatus TaxID=433685 RepID=A0A4Z2BJ30_9TELE|nr:hypothetical protein fugu_020128 [Takifugu bimaculatus]
MKLFLLSCLALVCYAENTKHTPPKVQVYSRNPGEFGQKNVLICHVSGFHPPDITIQLMKGEEELKDSNQTDLAFKEDWHFHLTKSVFFTPQHEEAYICKVTHGNKTMQQTSCCFIYLHLLEIFGFLEFLPVQPTTLVSQSRMNPE